MPGDIMGEPSISTTLAEECALIEDLLDILPLTGEFIGDNNIDIVNLSADIALIDTLGGNDDITVTADVTLIEAGNGNDDVTVVGNVGEINTAGGIDIVEVTGFAGTVNSGGGNDNVTINGSIKLLNTSGGNDNVSVSGNAHTLNLGGGSDVAVVEGAAGLVIAGAGNDDVTLLGGAETVRMGSGNDTLTVADLVAVANGQAGNDTLVFQGFNAGDFDVTISGDRITFADRFTGEEMMTRQFEEFVFEDRTFTIEEMLEDFGPDAVPYIQVGGGTQVVTVNDTDPGVSVIWDRVVQQAVIETSVPVGPTVASRAYAMMHTAMFDAWAAIDPTAVEVSFDAEGNNAALAAGLGTDDATKIKAMSYAALTVLRDLFPDLEDLYVSVMTERFGFDPDDTSSPEAVLGIDVAEDLLALRGSDGSNQAGGYTGAFTPTNPSPLAEDINDITAWTPENVPVDPEDGNPEQSFLTPQWEFVEGFAIDENPDGTSNFDSVRPVAPQPFFTDAFSDATLNFVDQTITLGSDGTIGGVAFMAGDEIPVSKALIGEVINEGFITQAEEVITFSAELTDEEKIIAEFWEDGGGTAFPPGTWMTFGQFVSARDNNSVDDDAALFFQLGNAVMDAGIATWEAKVFYDYVRPVRAIRDLGELGLIGEEGIDANTGEAGFVIEAFGGFNEDGTGRGTQTILAENFLTFQLPNGNASPPFAEYTSGHSAFSAAGAEILKLFTGSDDFGGSVDFEPDSIIFERGVPEEEVTLAWDTFTEGADEAGLSRLFGGIHFNEGDVNGRALGRQVAQDVFDTAQKFIDGTAVDEDRPFFVDELLPS